MVAGMPPDDGVRRIQRIWDRYAPDYDRDIQFWERLMIPGGREWICAQASGTTLEVAVGTGRNLPLYPRGTTVVGVDASRAMLSFAAGSVAGGAGGRALLVQGDAQALPLADCSVDTVVCTLGLCSVPDEHTAIAQMWRVLRPGGRLLLLDHVAAPNRMLRAVQWLWEQVTARLAADYQTRRPLPLLRRAGFVIEVSERSRAGTVERLRARKPDPGKVT
jgi:ubiquinone/menaquinone biosynthesis C-methylase UbiE